MKIKLDASNEKHRAIASCFVGCEVEHSQTMLGKTCQRDQLLGICDVDRFFLCYTNPIEEITLDLTTCQPNIYKCMEHGLRVGVEWEVDQNETDFGVHTYDLYLSTGRIDLLNDLEYHFQIKSIKILDLEEMEVEE